jgi:hypothetical protein
LENKRNQSERLLDSFFVRYYKDRKAATNPLTPPEKIAKLNLSCYIRRRYDLYRPHSAIKVRQK